MFGVVRLYLEPPPESVVLCVDEKTGMQALERVSPDKPMLPGKPLRREFGYIRHGTRALFAAFNPHTGDVLGKIFRRHRSKEFCEFLRLILRKHRGLAHKILASLAVKFFADEFVQRALAADHHKILVSFFHKKIPQCAFALCSRYKKPIVRIVAEPRLSGMRFHEQKQHMNPKRVSCIGIVKFVPDVFSVS